MLRKEITINIYSNYKVILLYCNYDTASKFFKRTINEEISEVEGLTVTCPDTYKSYVWVNSACPCWQVSLVHETVHVALDMCKIFTLKNIEHSQEQFTYLVDYIYGELFKYLNNTL